MSKHYTGTKLVLIVATVGLFFGAVATAVTKQPPVRRMQSPPQQQMFVADEILVKFKPQISEQFKTQSIAAYGGHQMRELSKQGHVQIKLPPGVDVSQAIARYAADSNVELVQPNYIYQNFAVPNDANYAQMWGLKNNGQTISSPSYPTNNPGRAGEDMDLEAAWDRITDCRSVVIAVIDSGVNYTHQDLAANMWDGSAAGFPNHGYDFGDNDNDPMPGPKESSGHGTHVSGTIGAVGNNNLGTTGVCWQAKIMAIRAMSSMGVLSSSALMQSIDFAVAHGAKVINMSLGGPNFDPAMEAAITNARNNKVIVVISAGNGDSNGVGVNNDTTPTWPCNSLQDNVLCVAALDQSYSLASFSNYGATTVDVGAPGVNTMSPWHGRTITDNFATGWNLSGGFAIGGCDPDGPGPLPVISMLTNPPNWCVGGNYLNNANDVAYKTFDLSAAARASLSFLTVSDVEFGFDFIGLASKSTGGDPFTAGGFLIDEVTGTTNNMIELGTADLSNCRTSTCSIGFRLRSDASVIQNGLGVLAVRIETLEANSAAYNTINGTSMASPHVAGLAALIWAYNPTYTYSDVITAIKGGGDLIPALSGKTTSGRAVNGMGSLRYITPPSGVAVVRL